MRLVNLINLILYACYIKPAAFIGFEFCPFNPAHKAAAGAYGLEGGLDIKCARY